MLDSSIGLSRRELPFVVGFIEDIVRQFYRNPDNIEIGLLLYSDSNMKYVLHLKKWSLRYVLFKLRYLKYQYRQGTRNYLGYALKRVVKVLLLMNLLLDNLIRVFKI